MPSNIAVAKVIKRALIECGIDQNVISVIEDTSRETTAKFMKLNKYVDLLIPRGSASLIKTAVENSTIPIIETLEILQNYSTIQDMNKNRFLAYMKNFTEQYSDEAARYVIENRKYKKSTIAFLERILTWYGVTNSLQQYLSPLSDYKIPSIEELRVSPPKNILSHLNEYVLELKKLYQDTLDKVILFGSYARGDYNEESDIDLMILLSISDLEIKNYQEKLSNLTYHFNMNYEIDIKPIAKCKEEFVKWIGAYPFYANVQREGVELFRVA